MQLVGLTGGIASGKTTVAHLFRELGVPVIDADQLARAVVAPGQPALASIARRFGPAILHPDGTLDRKRLGTVVFADPTARRELEAIIHPRIHQLLEQQVDRLAQEGVELAVYDVPLLYEAGIDREVDHTIVVYVPEQEQLRRLQDRDGLSLVEARRRLAAQMPLDEKAARADYVIDNTGSREETRRQVVAVLEALRSGGR